MTDSIRSMLEPIRWLANSGFKPDWLPGMKPWPGVGAVAFTAESAEAAENHR